jgi:hypothetical protein
MTFWALRENAVPGGGAGGTWLAIFVNSRINTKAAAKVAILFIELCNPRESPRAEILRGQNPGPAHMD